MDKIGWDAAREKLRKADHNKWEAALNSLSSDERRLVKIRRGEIIAPPEIKAKMVSILNG